MGLWEKRERSREWQWIAAIENQQFSQRCGFASKILGDFLERAGGKISTSMHIEFPGYPWSGTEVRRWHPCLILAVVDGRRRPPQSDESCPREEEAQSSQDPDPPGLAPTSAQTRFGDVRTDQKQRPTTALGSPREST